MRRHTALEEVMMPVVTGLGYFWTGLQVVPHGNHVLYRLFIDKKPGGVTVDDCSKVARQLNAVLSVEGVVRGAYTLEVSSPGMDRLLFNPEQCAEQLGKTITVRLLALKDEKRNFKGKLLKVEADVLSIETEAGLITLAFPDIAEARLVPEW
jgi:ribosome maturation factor RimP